MERDAAQLVGICGLHCGTCSYYLAHREDDTGELERISRAHRIPISEARCDGCLSDRVMPHCADCRHGFQRCAADKEVTWCFQCLDFPCQRLTDFLHVHVVSGVSHHVL